MKKLLIATGIIVVAGLGILIIARNSIVKSVLESAIKSMTGMTLAIDKLDVGIVKPVVHVQGLRLYNPPDFPDRVMVDLPEFYVAYDLPAILRNKIHCTEVRLDLKELTIVKNNLGKTNLESLTASAPHGTAARSAPQKRQEFQIDKLVLAVGTVTYKNYTPGGKPAVSEFKVNIHKTFEDITDPALLVSTIVGHALLNTPIASLGSLLGPMENEVKAAVGKATEAAGTVVGEVTKTGRGLTSVLEGLIPQEK